MECREGNWHCDQVIRGFSLMAKEPAVATEMQVIGRCLAYLCLQSEDGKKARTVFEKATLLQLLGLSLDEAAGLVGSSAASIRELERQARNKKAKGKSNAGAKKKK